MHGAAQARLGEAVSAFERAPASDDATWLAWLAGVGNARLALWPMVAPLAHKPLAKIPGSIHPR